MTRWLVAAALVACGGSQQAAPARTCELPEAGVALDESQCSCLGGRVNLARGAAVELPCDMGEHQLGEVQLGSAAGWCCQ